MNQDWVVGVDVSKGWLDVCALSVEGEIKERRFDNNPGGIEQILKFIRALKQVTCVGMESTGGYEFNLACAVHEAEFKVSVENPRRIRDFARAMGKLNKTDRADAKAIAEYLIRVGGSKWHLADVKVRHLCVLNRQRDFLLEDLQRCSSRLLHKERFPDIAVRQLEEQVALLNIQLKELEQAQLDLVENSESLKQDMQALTAICGVATTTALLVLSEAGDVENYTDAQSYAAAAGLNPCRKESGLMRGKTRLSKKGNARLRKGLYFSAAAAGRHHEVIKAFRQRLLQSGKTKMQALIACMRKLLMICYGVLKALRQGKTPYYGVKPALTT